MDSPLTLSTSKLLETDDERSGAIGGIEDFLQSAAYGAVQRPINGVVQFADHVGADIKAPDLISAPKDSNIETTAGTMAGTILDVAILSKATNAGLDGLGLKGTSLADRALSSGLMGLEMTVMQPVPEGTNYWAAKEKGLGQNISSFMIMSGISQPLQKYFGDSAVGTIFANTVAGAAGGVANVAVSDLVDWKKPTVDQLGTVATWAELGAVMGGIQVATPYVSSVASRVWKGISGGNAAAEDGSAAAEAGDGTNSDPDHLEQQSSLKTKDPEAGDKPADATKNLQDDSTNTDSDETAADKGAGNSKKNPLSRILRMALRRALMPKPAGLAGGRPGPKAEETGAEAHPSGAKPHESNEGTVKTPAPATENLNAPKPAETKPPTVSKDGKDLKIAVNDDDKKKKNETPTLPNLELVGDLRK